jgi:outer membrane murein-binding lipoprotein Lpp
MTRVNLVLVGAAAIFAVGCLLLLGDLSTERSRVRALESQVAQLQRDVERPRPAVASNETASANEPPAKIVATQPAVTPSATAASKPSTAKKTAEREREQQRRILSDPTYRAVAVAEHRRAVHAQYLQLASELGLSKEEADRFLDLLAEQSLRESESAMKEQDGEDMQKRCRALAEQQAKERRQLLGEQRFQAWTEYVNSAGARALVSELRTQLATSSSPLREEQIKPLVKALAAEQQRHWAERVQNYDGIQRTDEPPVAERVAYMERRAELVEQSVARSKEAGAMYLDSTQQRFLDELLERQSESARAEVTEFRAFWEAEERQRDGSRSR